MSKAIDLFKYTFLTVIATLYLTMLVSLCLPVKNDFYVKGIVPSFLKLKRLG